MTRPSPLDIFCREAKRTSGWTGGKPALSREEEETLVTAAQGGDITARDKLIETHTMYAVKYALRWTATGLLEDDLVQVAMLGLIEAINHHDISRGRLSTCAWWYMRNSIRSAAGDQCFEVRVSGAVGKDILRIRAGGKPRQTPRIKTLAAVSKAPVEIDGQQDNGEWLLGGEGGTDNRTMDNDLHKCILEALELIEDKITRRLVSMRFGMGELHGMTLGEAGRELGLGRESARQRQLAGLRTMFGHDGLREIGGNEMGSLICYKRVEEKRCPKCGLIKRWDKFGVDKRTRNGLKSWCLDCHNNLVRSRNA